jgi:hypothetical protein
MEMQQKRHPPPRKLGAKPPQDPCLDAESRWQAERTTGIDSFDGFSHSSDTISFERKRVAWASPANVLTPNASGLDGTTHLFVTSSPANASKGLWPRAAAEDAPVATPEPSSLSILGVVLGLLCFAGRRLVA